MTVARISPSGFYAASADTSGSVRVWDLASGDRLLKLQTQALGGRISDLAWDGESKRLIVVGDGRERFGHAFAFDTGSSVGEISGHSKVVNAVAIRAQRPFRAVTAGDDTHLVFFTGVPFKFAKTLSGHTRFVQDVAYAKDGATFASVGSDGQLLVYDGTSGDTRHTVRDAHTGSVYAVNYAPDSAHLVTAGADGLVKVWRVADAELLGTFDAKTLAASRVDAQQVGVVWAQPTVVVSVGLEGALYVLDVDLGAGRLTHRASLRGPTKGVSGLAPGAAPGALGAGSYDGRVYEYAAGGEVRAHPQASGAPSVVGVAAGDALYSIALDDTCGRVAADAPRAALTAQPRGMAGGAPPLVVSERGVDVVDGAQVTHQAAAALGVAEPTAVARGGALVAVGTADAQVHLYTAQWERVATLANGRSAITALAFSPDGALLAAGETSGKILVYDVAKREVRGMLTQLKLSHWVAHSARIAALAWAADGAHCASASLDTHVYVWSVARPMKHAVFKNAHAGGATGVAWVDGATLATAGADGVVRTVRGVPDAVRRGVAVAGRRLCQRARGACH